MRVPLKSTILKKYLHIPDEEYILGVYLDYYAFYGDFQIDKRAFFESIFRSDNDKTITRGHFTISKHLNYYYVNTVYDDHIVQVATIKQMVISSQYKIKIDLKGKGLLVMQKQNSFNDLMDYLRAIGLDEIVITRIDYAIDLKGNGRLFMSPENFPQKSQDFMVKNVVTYRSFGSRISSVFIRFYDKKLDLYDKGFTWLYPEYTKHSEIIRQEVQLNGRGIKDRKTTISNLKTELFVPQIITGRQGSDLIIDHGRSLERALVQLLRRIKKTNNIESYKIIQEFYFRNISNAGK